MREDPKQKHIMHTTVAKNTSKDQSDTQDITGSEYCIRHEQLLVAKLCKYVINMYVCVHDLGPRSSCKQKIYVCIVRCCGYHVPWSCNV